MESVAPAVVAVVVTRDPGPWFEETLRSLAAQDYPELSVLVLDAASAVDPTPTVAAILPGAFVRRLPDNRGFAASVDSVLGMVSGASHLLLCHDDVALDPNVVHVLVEESFRSNAGVVAPKLVTWDDPTRLLHVGMAVDKGGAVVDRVEPGEIDHGQHDAVQDVFLAPGGCTLVRADLFAELGGLDPTVVAMGDDLDLCWRAQVAGARVIVAPGARVRHLELMANGQRPPPVATPSLQALQRRHELRIVLISYGRLHLLRVLPQLIALALGEMALALLSGHRDRAAAVAHAWRWNWAMHKELRADRAAVRARRRLSDSDVRRLQLRGSSRLTSYFRRLFTHGLEAAHAGGHHSTLTVAGLPEPQPVTSLPATPDVLALSATDTAPGAAIVPAEEPSSAPSFGVDGPAGEPLAGHLHTGDAVRPPGAQLSGSRRAVVWSVVILVLLVGSRQLIGTGFPSISGLLSWPAWQTILHRFAVGAQSPGLGGTDPTSPVSGPLGVLALLLFGSSGLAQIVVVLGCLPVGAWGMTRLARPFGSPRARLAATLAYLALPVFYDALAVGRWDALVAYSLAPWIVGRLARASELAPFVVADDHPSPRRRWRRGPAGQLLAMGILEAVLCSVAPTGAVLVLLMAVGLGVGALIVLGRAGWRPAGRMVGMAVGSTVVAGVLLAPWSITLLLGPQRWAAVAGLSLGRGSVPTWSSLLRLAVGPIGDTPLAYGLVVAGLLPLVIAVRQRLTWAAMGWGMVGSSWVLAWAEGRGWTGVVSVDTQMLLVPAAVGVALAIGLGVAAFERDLSAYRFGLRQAGAALAAAFAIVGALPTVAAAGGGRWGLPLSGYGEATAWLAARAPAGGFRVLWLADPRTLPGGGWQLGPGVAYGVTEDGMSDATGLWAGSSPGPAAVMGQDVELAEHHDTVQLGRLIATQHVRYVVVVQALAPEIPGYQSTPVYPVPATLTEALDAQTDLSQVPGQGGLDVYQDTVSAPGPLPARGEASPWPYRIGLWVEVVVWVAAVFALLGVRRWMGRWRRRRKHRRHEAIMAGTNTAGSSNSGQQERRVASTPAGVGG
jgi:GT2 family glycosyltransferase